jgi:thioredoxin-related protein
MVLGILVDRSPGGDKTPSPPWQSDMRVAWQSARASHRPLILYFKMANCVYCRKMEKETFSDKALAADIQERFVAANVTLEQHADLVRQYRVRTFPTTVIVTPAGGVIDQIPGYIGANDLRGRLRIAAETQTTVRR